jgi:hypothetical protein
MDASGRAVAGAKVVGWDGAMAVGAVTDATGFYSLAGLPMGRRVASCVLRGARTAHVVVEVRDQGTIAPDITLAPLAEQLAGAPVLRQVEARPGPARGYVAVVECLNVDSACVVLSTPAGEALVPIGTGQLAETAVSDTEAVMRAVTPLGSAAIGLVAPGSGSRASVTVTLAATSPARVRLVVAGADTGLPVPESGAETCTLGRPGTFALGVQCISSERNAPADAVVIVDTGDGHPREVPVRGLEPRYDSAGNELRPPAEAFRNVGTLILAPDGACSVDGPSSVAFQLTWEP